MKKVFYNLGARSDSDQPMQLLKLAAVLIFQKERNFCLFFTLSLRQEKSDADPPAE